MCCDYNKEGTAAIAGIFWDYFRESEIQLVEEDCVQGVESWSI